MTPELLAPNFERMLDEARAWHTPLFVGEWGIRPDSPGTDDYIAFTYDLFDGAAASAAVWVWKESSQGRWGFFDCDPADVSFASCAVRPEQMAAHARVYAERIAGEPGSPASHYDVASSVFTLHFTGRTDDAPHVLRLPTAYPAVFEVRCDGAVVEPAPKRDPVTGRLEVRCAGPGSHEVVVAPR